MTRRKNSFWIIMSVLWVGALLLGITGFARHAQIHQQDADTWDFLYATLQLIPMNSGAVISPVPFELQLARFLMPLLTWTAALQGAMSLFRHQVQMTRLRSLRRHIIICGLSRKGMLLTQRFRERGDEVVVVEWEELNAWIEPCRELGAFILLGNATSPAMLRRAGVEYASGLFAVCDDDGVNAEIAIRVKELVKARLGGQLTCLAHVTDPQLCAMLRDNTPGLEQRSFQLELFSQFERGAREMLRAFPAWDGDLQNDRTGRAPHVLIVGIGQLGEALVIQAGRNWCNEKQRAYDSRLRMTLIDRDAEQKLASLLLRYPALATSCEIRAVSCDIHSYLFERADFLLDDASLLCVDVIYVCLDNDSLGLNAALTLQRRLPKAAHITTVIRMAEEGGLATLINGGPDSQPERHGMYAFGLLARICTIELLHSTPRDVLARAAHEEYRHEQLRLGITEADNPSIAPWDQLSPDLQAANYRWTDRIHAHVTAAGYRIGPLTDWYAPAMSLPAEMVQQIAREEHNMWRREREAEGWHYRSGKKDPLAMTHPDLVDWEDLSEEEKEKNRLLASSIPAFLGRAGFQLVKE